MKLPLVIDNIIPEEKQNELNYIMFDTLFPWVFKKSLSKDPESEKDFFVDATGFAHVFYNDLGMMSNFYDYTMCIVDAVCDKLNFELKKLYSGRVFFQLPLEKNQGMSRPHIDLPNTEHMVIIYYALDSDGDTILFENQQDLNSKLFTTDNITKRITPKKGRALVFNGNEYHSNFLPKENMRCIINFNLVLNKKSRFISK
jgi:hypothetical protein